jgi:hypothetical protein
MMRIVSARRACVLLVALAAGTAAAEIAAAGQAGRGGEPLAPPKVAESSQLSASADQIFAELVKHNELRNARLREYSAVRTYSVADLQGKIHAKATVRMNYVAPDKKTFVAITEEGSGVVRRLVLNRLMDSEVSAAAGQDHRDSSITPANYTFALVGQEDLDLHRCFVVAATPKRKDTYLFEGKVWIDSTDFAIVQIAGHPAKKLSFWITRADFIRQYEKVGDFWLPLKDQTFVDVKLYGKKVLSIEHRIATVNGESNPLASEPAVVYSSGMAE